MPCPHPAHFGPKHLKHETEDGGCEERIFQMPKFPVPTTATRRENHYANIIPTATAHTTDRSATKFTASDFTCAMPLPCHCIVNRNGGQRFCCLSSSQTRYATSEGARGCLQCNGDDNDIHGVIALFFRCGGSRQRCRKEASTCAVQSDRPDSRTDRGTPVLPSVGFVTSTARILSVSHLVWHGLLLTW